MFHRSPPTPCSFLCVVSLGLFSGCASDSDAVEKRLSELREDIRKLQNDNDRVSERLEALELRQAAQARSTPAPAEAAPETVSRPRLKVVRLSPDGKAPTEAEPAEAQPAPDEAPTMILKGEGKELELKPGAARPSSRSAPQEKPVVVSQNEGASPSGGAP